jgi:hypothetical protein
MRRSILVASILLLASTVGISQIAHATSAVPSRDDSGWDGNYEKVPAELCKPDGPATNQPFFSQPVEEQGSEGVVWVQHGLVLNEQSELFRFDVQGFDENEVVEYTSKVMTCFDQLFTGDPIGDEPQTDSDATPSAPNAQSTPADLVISIDFLGVFGLVTSATSVVDHETLVSMLQAGEISPTDSIEQLKERGLLPAADWATDKGEQYVIDMVIDPSIAANKRHKYYLGWKSQVHVTVNITNGSPKGFLAYNTSTNYVDSGTALDYGKSGYYGICVQSGTSSGTYTLTGRSGTSVPSSYTTQSGNC